MEHKNINFITVQRDFHITGTSTDEIVKKFKGYIDSGLIDVDKAILCKIYYVIMEGKVEDGPVSIYFLDGTRVRLNLTAGYCGSGPRDTCTILNLCKFNFKEEDIFRHQEIVDIKICKDIDSSIVYQFKNMDGSYEYSNM